MKAIKSYIIVEESDNSFIQIDDLTFDVISEQKKLTEHAE